MTFFSSIQGLFNEKADGRYIGHLIKAIGTTDPTAVYPFIRKKLKSEQISIETEYFYAPSSKGNLRADLMIDIQGTGRVPSKKIIVEIKVNDHLRNGQLSAYADWVKSDKSHELILLAAFPLIDRDKQEWERLKNERFHRMYFSDYISNLDINDQGSKVEHPLLSYLVEYFYEMGYCMHNFTKNVEDLRALKSFMVLSFLQHQAGFGKVATLANIATGPAAFGKLIQNWQLTSARVGEMLGSNRTPTTRYIPQQGESHRTPTKDIGVDNLFDERRNLRTNREWGRYWINSILVAGGPQNTSIRLEWGQVIQIEVNKKKKEEELPNAGLSCGIYAVIRQNSNVMGETQLVWVVDGIMNKDLYDPGKFAEIIYQQIELATLSLPSEVRSAIKREWSLAAS